MYTFEYTKKICAYQRTGKEFLWHYQRTSVGRKSPRVGSFKMYVSNQLNFMVLVTGLGDWLPIANILDNIFKTLKKRLLITRHRIP